MEALSIEETELTPRVEFDTILGKFEFSKSSFPENAIGFYKPLIEWVDKYMEQPSAKTVFEFKLNYFNTSSSKQIFRLLKLLVEGKDSTKLSIQWYYQEADIDMKRSGERYQALLDFPFQFVTY